MCVWWDKVVATFSGTQVSSSRGRKQHLPDQLRVAKSSRVGRVGWMGGRVSRGDGANRHTLYTTYQQEDALTPTCVHKPTHSHMHHTHSHLSTQAQESVPPFAGAPSGHLQKLLRELWVPLGAPLSFWAQNMGAGTREKEAYGGNESALSLFLGGGWGRPVRTCTWGCKSDSLHLHV